MSSVSSVPAATNQTVALSADVKLALQNLKSTGEQIARSTETLSSGTASRGTNLDVLV